MRLVSIGRGGGSVAGLLAGERVVPLADLEPSLPPSLTEIVRAWPAFRERLLALDVAAGESSGLPLAEVRLALPFDPPRVLATGGNYAEHLGELRTTGASAPSGFLKLPGAVQGPGVPLELRPEDRFVDYEGEIAMVVGAPARDLDVEQAGGCIAGLMLANDVSARDAPTSHITLAKGQRGFCPLGPWLVTVDELHLDDISFAVDVNGTPRQSTSTAKMIHGFAKILASYSRALALEPGDVVLTGTPGGVGLSQRPASFLAPGDQIVVSSPQLGSLHTPVVAAGSGA